MRESGLPLGFVFRGIPKEAYVIQSLPAFRGHGVFGFSLMGNPRTKIEAIIGFILKWNPVVAKTSFKIDDFIDVA